MAIPAKAVDGSIDCPTMMTGQPLTTRARVTLRVVGVLAVVAGIVGMHGLANHGVTGMEGMGQPVVAATASSAAMVTVVAVPSTVSTVAEAVPSMPSGMDMEMAGWCIAVLMLGVGAMSLLLRGKGLRLSPWVVRLPGSTVQRLGRDPDPPSLRHLSIQRC